MKSTFSKTTILLFLLGGCVHATISAQSKYIDKNGTIVFEASEKLFEEVKAKNESVTVLFDEATQKIASLALMRGFHFKNSLMEEHFNENYIESETYPKATFRGELSGLKTNELTEKSVDIPVTGVLELHGKKKEIQTNLKTQKVGDIISMTGSFEVTPGDFDIEIPKIVRNKIAKVVLVKMDFKLVKK